MDGYPKGKKTKSRQINNKFDKYLIYSILDLIYA